MAGIERVRFSREIFEPGPGFEPGSNFSFENLNFKFYKAWNL